MKNSRVIIALLVSLVCGIICASIVNGCTVATPAPEIESFSLPDPFVEFFEEPDGLHVTTKKWVNGEVEYSDILIELEDEKQEYTFAVDGWEYDILFMRTGNPTQGVTAVYVVLLDQIYSIDSHRIGKPRTAGMRTL